jgi:hypothetical protein
MLEFLQGKASDRKLRLFAVACCRRAWELMPSADCRLAVDAAEQTADGHFDASALYRMSDKINTVLGSLALSSEGEEYAAIAAGRVSSRDHLHMTDEAAAVAIAVHRSSETWESERRTEGKCQAALLRDNFGNPFRPVTADPAWLTSSVRALAEGIYAERAFDRMPVLADALEDAGCGNAEVLDHCRSGGLHARGCWVVDLLLGKE